MTTSHARNVFVVFGRNRPIHDALCAFLQSLDLRPVEWTEAITATGVASPHISQILEAGLAMSKAVVVLLTPDDEARLREPYRGKNEPEYESRLMPQPRPNVWFEAGMAMGKFPRQTVIVEIGNLRPVSDISGLHTVRLDNSTENRQDLALRLQTAGCDINMTGTAWHKVGDFTIRESEDKTPA